LTGERLKGILEGKLKPEEPTNKESRMKQYQVGLSQEQRQQLEQEVKTGKGPARQLTHARILLKADEGEQGPGWSDEQISEALEVSVPTIERVRRRFVEAGLQEAIRRRPQPERPQKRKINGEQEAYLIALACSEAPGGYDHWTMRLLADKMVALGYVEEVSHKTVWETLKKTNSSRG
jgi:transposase